MPLGVKQFCRGVHPETVRGLFHGKSILAGWKCVDKGKRPKTRRAWQPNVQYKFLYSEALQRRVRLFVTTHTLKRIDAAGGLDMYLLTEPLASRESIVGQQLKNLISNEYVLRKQPLPVKQGPTSVLQIVNQKLKAAGFLDPCKAGAALDGNSQASVSGQSGDTAASSPQSGQTQDLNPGAGDGSRQDSKMRAGTNINAKKARRKLMQLTSGKRVRQEVAQAHAVAEREHAIKQRRTRNRLKTMQVTTQNMLRQGLALKQVWDACSAETASLKSHRQAAMLDGTSGKQKPDLKIPVSSVPADIKRAHFPGKDVPCLLVNGHYVPAISPRRIEDGHITVKSRFDAVSLFMYPHGKKVEKLWKWRDMEDWIPKTDERKLVLPNGMTLWSERRSHAPEPGKRGKRAATKADVQQLLSPEKDLTEDSQNPYVLSRFARAKKDVAHARMHASD